MRILILGASGLVGKALFKELNQDYEVYGTYNKQHEVLPKGKGFKLDMNDSKQLSNLLDEIRPVYVVSCLTGGFAAQLSCHQQVANYLKGNGGKLIFCSTANVFDGNPWHAHDELEKPYPISQYGKFKVRCEEMLEEILGENSVIVRLPGIMGHDSRDWKEIQDGYNKGSINMFSNVYVTKNTDVNVAKSIHYIITQGLEGIIHLTSKDIVKMSDLTKEMAVILKIQNPNYCEEECTIEKYYAALGCKECKGLKEPVDCNQLEYYVALKSTREDLPKFYQITNEQVLDCRR